MEVLGLVVMLVICCGLFVDFSLSWLVNLWVNVVLFG